MTDRSIRVRACKRPVICLLASLGLAQAACSGTSSTPERRDNASTNGPAAASATASAGSAAPDLGPTRVSATAPGNAIHHPASKILGKQDRILSNGTRACDVDFVYASRAPEDVFWEEPCGSVSARMVGRSTLEALGGWNRLDGYQRKFVTDMPGGLVLYVAGDASASIYPIDETGTSIEVSIAD